jgi:peptidoglycan/LPS O-acetylase OafA/YrhL
LTTPSSTELQLGRKDALDTRIHGLRGICALMVFGYHAWSGLGALGLSATAVSPILGPVFYALQCGVDFFFMISGYLIMGSLARHGAFRPFIVDRLIRVVPAYYFPTILIFCLGPLIGYGGFLIANDPSRWTSSLASNLLFYAEFLFKRHALPVAWSLDYEMLFYLLAGACFTVGCRLGRRAALVAAALIAAPLLLTIPRFACFVCGILAYFYLEPASRSRLTAPALAPFWFAATLAYIAAVLPDLDQKLLLAILPGFLFLVALLRNEGATARALRLRPVQFMGTISYSFYLWHIVMMFAAKPVLKLPMIRDLGGAPRAVIFVLVALAGSLAVSWASWRLLEAGAGRWIKSLLRRGARPIAAPPISAATVS